MLIQESKKVAKMYGKFLRNRTVVLVGPSYHTKGTKQVDIINSYDVVVRMNIGFRVTSEKVRKDIGDRINVLYCGLSTYFFHTKLFSYESFKDMKKRGLKWIVCTHQKGTINRLKKVNESSKFSINIVPKKDYKYVRNKMKKKPSTGIVTVYNLLQYDIKKLYITGMSFYDIGAIKKRRSYYGGYQDNIIYIDKKKINHNMVRETGLMRDLYENDKRIECDEVLKEILQR